MQNEYYDHVIGLQADTWTLIVRMVIAF